MTDIHESLKPLAVSIDSLTPDPSNARKHDKRNIEAIKASLARFGQTKPIVLHSNGTTIIAGNGTWHAAKELGWTHIAAAKTNLDTAEAVAYGIADNKTAELAEWEDDTLRDLMDALPDDLKLATGFEGDEIAEMLRLPSDEVHEDEVPPTPKEPTTQPGDLWLLGDHRVLCGDSTNVQHVDRLTDGALIDVVYTDPPYGINYSGKGQAGKTKPNDFGQIANDESTNAAKEVYQLVSAMHVDLLIFWGANYYCDIVESECAWLVWNKEVVGDTYSAAELAWTNKKGRTRMFTHQWHGMIKASEQSQSRVHPTQKPVALAEWCFQEFNAGNNVLDLFGGSGSTLIACEQSNKRCFVMELEPKYCDVIVQRWENLTGKKAERVPAEVGDASTVGS